MTCLADEEFVGGRRSLRARGQDLLLNNDNSRLLGELTDNGKVFGFLKECFLRWLESFLS